MSETLQNIIGILLLVLVFILTRYGVGLKAKKAGLSIIDDLRKRNAVDVYSAVHLDYAKTSWLKFGLRDYRPRAIQSLVQAGVIGMTGDEKYYLIQDFAQGKGVEE